ncbi:MAG: hypothetical protein Q6365_023745, partial [Candidatus Sigynarchaeota archaeon]
MKQLTTLQEKLKNIVSSWFDVVKFETNDYEFEPRCIVRMRLDKLNHEKEVFEGADKALRPHGFRIQ